MDKGHVAPQNPLTKTAHKSTSLISGHTVVHILFEIACHKIVFPTDSKGRGYVFSPQRLTILPNFQTCQPRSDVIPFGIIEGLLINKPDVANRHQTTGHLHPLYTNVLDIKHWMTMKFVRRLQQGGIFIHVEIKP